VTNVASFGAFVDVGVHQDGLLQISAMPNTYVKDQRKITKPGDVVRFKVLEVDPKRRRISLTMRLDEAPDCSANYSTHRDRPIGIGQTPPTRVRAEAIPCPPAATGWPRRFGEQG